jgi:hypothetical protein
MPTLGCADRHRLGSLPSVSSHRKLYRIRTQHGPNLSNGLTLERISTGSGTIPVSNSRAVYGAGGGAVQRESTKSRLLKRETRQS